MINLTKALEIQGYMNYRALEWLAQQAQTHEVIVELGSFCGRSTRALADNTRGVVYAIDDWNGVRKTQAGTRTKEMEEDGPISYMAFCLNMKDLMGRKVIPINLDHAKADEFIRTNKFIFPDMVFIDGDHDYESVKRDILTWDNELSISGLLCGDDISWPGVEQAVKELVPEAVRV